MFNTRLKTDSALEFVHDSCVTGAKTCEFYYSYVIIVIVTIACSGLSRTSVNLIFCVVKPQGKYKILLLAVHIHICTHKPKPDFYFSIYSKCVVIYTFI